MGNPIKSIKTWFFELIEDAVGSKAMKQFKTEEDNHDHAKNEIKK